MGKSSLLTVSSSQPCIPRFLPAKIGVSPEERAILERLDTIVRSKQLQAVIGPIAQRVRADLARKPEAVMAWQPIPLTIHGDPLLESIRSSWVFVLRRGTNTGPERHPNSHQRMMSFEGGGNMQVRHGDDLPWQIERPGRRCRSAIGAEVDFDPAECLASTSSGRSHGLGGGFFPHCSRRGVNRGAAAFRKCYRDKTDGVLRESKAAAESESV